ncbi:MAG TPA: hypothetical protein VHE79_02665, partial [Spirochaetia bacterium]
MRALHAALLVAALLLVAAAEIVAAPGPAAPSPAAAETLGVSLAVTPAAAAALPAPDTLRDAVGRLFGAEYGRFCAVTFDAAAAPPVTAAVRIDVTAAGFSVSTDLVRGGATRSLVSVVPAGSPPALVATVTADVAYLYFLSLGFSPFPLSPPPSLTATLDTDA